MAFGLSYFTVQRPGEKKELLVGSLSNLTFYIQSRALMWKWNLDQNNTWRHVGKHEIHDFQ